MSIEAINAAFGAAIACAERTIGATAPNPPVGCAAIDASGRLLAVAAHQRAGSPHAEALVLRDLAAAGRMDAVHALVATLEPCNHHGRTPPCTQAIIASGITRVWIGASDPNPRVAGHGSDALRAAGIRVEQIAGIPALRHLARRCETLVRPFEKWTREARPWIVVKQALDADGSMIPPAGCKTFTSPESLVLAHELRRQSDAVLTGIGTVLADLPAFTVRHVADHPGKRRLLLVMDRHGRTPSAYRREAALRGFDIEIAGDYPRLLDEAGRRGCLRLLVEAGPTLTRHVADTGLWDEWITFAKSPHDGEADRVTRRSRRIV